MKSVSSGKTKGSHPHHRRKKGKKKKKKVLVVELKKYECFNKKFRSRN